MSIIYKPKKMVCAIPGKEKTGYFAAKVSGGTLSFHDLCDHISDRCSMNSSDIKGVMDALATELELQFLHGCSVKLDDLGIFSVSVTSSVEETVEKLKPKTVRVKTITFLPASRLKKELKRKAEFVRQAD